MSYVGYMSHVSNMSYVSCMSYGSYTSYVCSYNQLRWLESLEITWVTLKITLSNIYSGIFFSLITYLSASVNIWG